MLFGLLLAGISSVVGVAAGAVQGYFGGWTDLLMQRFIEIWSSLPSLYLLIILSSIIAPSFFVLLGILLAFSWVHLVHVVRAEFLRARNFDYVRAARALGLSNRKIMLRHVLPNAMVATLTFLPFILNSSITTLTSLDFLGFGLPPGSPSLGELLLQGKSNLQAPWLGLSGFAVIAVTLSLLVFIGEAHARRLRSEKDLQLSDLLDISGLTVAFGDGVPVVNDVSLTLKRGRTLGLVGESGSGKSVTALAIVRLLAPGAKIRRGAIRFQGQDLVCSRRSRAAKHSRRENLHGVPGADDLAQSAAQDRAADRRNSRMARHGLAREAPGAGAGAFARSRPAERRAADGRLSA